MADKIVNTGFIITTSALSVYASTPKWIQWGTGGAVAPASGDTTLSAARNEARTNGTVSLVTVSATNDTYQVAGSITVAGTSGSISEVGLFDAAGAGAPATGGNMFTHSTFAGLPLNIGDSISFTIKVTMSSAT